MTPRHVVNGVAAEQIAITDRGLAYGDGVFETLLVANGQPVWWDAHLARLQRGCEALGIAAPAATTLDAEARALIAGQSRAVLKILVTRGAGGRGYGADPDLAPTRVLSLHAAPMLAPDDVAHGVAVRWCDTRLAIQPRLAGLKHLNRLEQVLARNEWRDDAIAEGLMRDLEGRAVCATSANLFVVRGGALLTPALHRCGVAGTARSWVLQRHDVAEVDLTVEDIEQADELLLCSSVRGILPVARLGGRRWNAGPMTQSLQAALWRDVPALRPATSQPS